MKRFLQSNNFRVRLELIYSEVGLKLSLELIYNWVRLKLRFELINNKLRLILFVVKNLSLWKKKVRNDLQHGNVERLELI